jgi:hypothetical protein
MYNWTPEWQRISDEFEARADAEATMPNAGEMSEETENAILETVIEMLQGGASAR